MKITSLINGKEYPLNSFKKHLFDNNISISEYIYQNKIPIKVKSYSDNYILTSSKCCLCGESLNISVVGNSFNYIGCSKKCIFNKKGSRDIRNKLAPLLGTDRAEQIYKNIQSNSGVTLEKLIQKYGVVEGNIRYNNWIKQCGQSEESFILRYGEEEGLRRFNIFKNKSKHTREKYIKLYGEKEGEVKWGEYIQKKKRYI